MVPEDEPLLEPFLAALDPEVRVIRFGDVPDLDLDLNLSKGWQLRNAAAALACCRALDRVPAAGSRVEVALSAMRGQERPLPGGGVLIEDCYNANPLAMRAALADLAAPARAPRGRARRHDGARAGRGGVPPRGGRGGGPARAST